jgi:hypothetical protein
LGIARSFEVAKEMKLTETKVENHIGKINQADPGNDRNPAERQSPIG